MKINKKNNSICNRLALSLKLANKQAKSSCYGFTLVELLIVTAIISLLAGGIAMNSGTAVDTSEASAIYSNLKTLKNAGITYFAETTGDADEPKVRWGNAVANEYEENDKDYPTGPINILLKYLDSTKIGEEIVYAIGEDPWKREIEGKRQEGFFVGFHIPKSKIKIGAIVAKNDGVSYAIEGPENTGGTGGSTGNTIGNNLKKGEDWNKNIPTDSFWIFVRVR